MAKKKPARSRAKKARTSTKNKSSKKKATTRKKVSGKTKKTVKEQKPVKAAQPAALRNLDVDGMEQRTIEKVSHTMSAIESAIAVWDAAKNKPAHLKARVTRLKRFYEALAKWEKKTLKARAMGSDMEERLMRLHHFSELCHSFA